MLGNFLKIDYIVVCFLKPVNSAFFMGNDGLIGKQVGSQASRRVNRRLAWIQPVCISINAVPTLKGSMSYIKKIFLLVPRANSLAVSSASFGQGTGSIVLDDVKCLGSEANIAQCANKGWYNNDCSHKEDVGVICNSGMLTWDIGDI